MSFAINPSIEMEAEERKVIDTFIKVYIDKLLATNGFNEQKKQEATNVLKSNLALFERIDTKKIFNRGEVLTSEEKRNLGINTRLKVTSNFLNYLNLEFVDKTELFGFIDDAEFYARSRAWSEREINRASKLNVSLSLNIDKDSCPDSIRAQGKYIVNQAVLLPLPTCGKRCLCNYAVDVAW